jgi:hypothetical protein
MNAIEHMASSIGQFEMRLLAHIPRVSAHTTDPTGLGAISIAAAIGLVMYALMGKRRV